ncbi:hypothetical protein EBX93_16175 [bacterium]|nr:hypothetical protein [bacterium]
MLDSKPDANPRVPMTPCGNPMISPRTDPSQPSFRLMSTTISAEPPSGSRDSPDRVEPAKFSSAGLIDR